MDGWLMLHATQDGLAEGKVVFRAAELTGGGDTMSKGFSSAPIHWTENPDGTTTCEPITLLPDVGISGTVSPADAEAVSVGGCQGIARNLDDRGSFSYRGSGGKPCDVVARGTVDGQKLEARVTVDVEPGGSVDVDLVMEPVPEEPLDEEW